MNKIFNPKTEYFKNNLFDSNIFREICDRLGKANIDIDIMPNSNYWLSPRLWVNRTPHFLSALFGEAKTAALLGESVVVVGAGSMGLDLVAHLQRYNLNIAGFSDKKKEMHGQRHLGFKVRPLSYYVKNFPAAIYVIAVVGFEDVLFKQLIDFGISEERIRRKPIDKDYDLIPMFIDEANFYAQQGFSSTETQQEYLSVIGDRIGRIEQAYHQFHDDTSRDLFISKLTLHASHMNYAFFMDFMKRHSEPLRRYGAPAGCSHNATENYFYFNNDVIQLRNNEIYLDVGAYDGDTVASYMDAASLLGVKTKQIYALEPDPKSFERLSKAYGDHELVSCHELGLFGYRGEFSFSPSGESDHNEKSGHMDISGPDTVQLTSLDEFLGDKRVTLIKMDPPGGIVNDIISGGKNVIQRDRPSLVLGTYHTLDEFIETPITLKSFCPDYKIFLRHNTYHLCDTALYAVV